MDHWAKDILYDDKGLDDYAAIRRIPVRPTIILATDIKAN